MENKNLSPKLIKLLRKVQRFLLKEPRRFNMAQGILNYDNPTFDLKTQLEEPPCGTACCIAGAAFAISNKIVFSKTSVPWYQIEDNLKYNYGLDGNRAGRLFFVPGVHPLVTADIDGWPEHWAKFYREAKTAYERTLIGVAYIEHYIAIDGEQES